MRKIAVFFCSVLLLVTTLSSASALSYDDLSIHYSGLWWIGEYWCETEDNNFSVSVSRATQAPVGDPVSHYRMMYRGENNVVYDGFYAVGRYGFNILNHLDISKNATFDITINASIVPDSRRIFIFCGTLSKFIELERMWENGTTISVQNGLQVIADALRNNVPTEGIYGGDWFVPITGYQDYTISIKTPENFDGYLNLMFFDCVDGFDPTVSWYPNTVDLSPTGETLNLWKDVYFKDEVIGSEETGGLRGIFYQLKQIPEKIGNFIKSLFLPEEGFIQQFFDRLKEFFHEKFGFIYQTTVFIKEFVEHILTFDPPISEDITDYDLYIPSLKFWLGTQEGTSEQNGFLISESEQEGLQEFELIPDDGGGQHRIDLSIFNNGRFSFVYPMYRILITFILIVGCITFGLTKYDQVFGGH